jgi:hypothetical protein
MKSTENKDTLICEYDGIGMDAGRGKFRKWKNRLASGNKDVFLLKVNDTKEIYLYAGDPEYYMDDLSIGYDNDSLVFYYYEKNAEGTTDEIFINTEELYEMYKVKILSWDYAKPIKNSFSTTKK